jgi:hypothetical protein
LDATVGLVKRDGATVPQDRRFLEWVRIQVEESAT